MIKPYFNRFVADLARYNINQQEQLLPFESATIESDLKRSSDELITQISRRIKLITHTPPNEKYYDVKLQEYTSNTNLRKTLNQALVEYKELKEVPEEYVQNQVFNTIDRMFRLPIETRFQSLNSSKLDPLFTQLTRLILTEPLIDILNYDSNEEEMQVNTDEEEMQVNSDVDEDQDLFEIEADIRLQAMRNLGYGGLQEIQKILGSKANQISDCRRNEVPVTIEIILDQINNYQGKLDSKNLDLNLLLRIFNEELKYQLRQNPSEQQSRILKPLAEILCKFDLKLNSSLITKIINALPKLNDENRFSVLTLLQSTIIDPNLDSKTAQQIVKEMLSLLEKDPLPAHFLIRNPQLISPQTIEDLIINLGKNNEEISLFAFKILEKLSRNDFLKDSIRDSLWTAVGKITNPNIQTKNYNSSSKNLYYLLLLLKPLELNAENLTSIYEIYTSQSQRGKDDNIRIHILSNADNRSFLKLLEENTDSMEVWQDLIFNRTTFDIVSQALFDNQFSLATKKNFIQLLRTRLMPDDTVETELTINKFFEFHLDCLSKLDRNELLEIEECIRKCISDMSSAAEPYLLKIISMEGSNPRQKQLAESILFNHSYLPELVQH